MPELTKDGHAVYTVGERAVVLEYGPALSDDQKAQVYAVKRRIADLIDDLTENNKSRATSVATTKLEEACMWAVKAITNPGL